MIYPKRKFSETNRKRRIVGQSNIIIAVPGWLRAVEAAQAGTFPSVEARVALAVELAQRNIDEGTGGPFGAAVFDLTTHTLVAAGVNLVTSAACSIAHAEMVAIARTQQRLKTWDLSAVGRFELATSCAPCAMCLGRASAHCPAAPATKTPARSASMKAPNPPTGRANLKNAASPSHRTSFASEPPQSCAPTPPREGRYTENNFGQRSSPHF